MKSIFLVLIVFSLGFADFSKSGNIVTDNNTSLQWQDDKLSSQTKWENAVSSCKNLTLDGKSDWRLPNINELTSTVDYTAYNPAISSVFEYIHNSYYWSSTTNVNNVTQAIIVHYGNGGHGLRYKTGYNHAYRCVRGGE